MNESWRRYLLPALGAIVLFAAAVVAGYVTKTDGSPRSSTDLEAIEATGTGGVVQSVSGNTLTLSINGRPQQFTLAGDVTVETLRPVTAQAIATGDWLNVGVRPNSQTLFTIVGLTLIPPAVLDR